MTSPASGARRRIGVLTFHRCINYGSYWQARSLVQGLCRRGHDARLLDHSSMRIDSAEWRCAMQPLLPERSSRAEIRLYAKKARAFRQAVDALPLSSRFPLERPETLEPYDCVVIGSDEVWNLSHPWYQGLSIFFGERISAPRVVSYAASFGNHDAATGLDGHRAGQLRKFAAISVRDENSRRLVRDALGEEPAVVLDPCLQFPPAPDEHAAAAADGGPFALLYGHGFPDWFAELARGWANERGLRLISVGYRNAWAHEHRLDAGPLEFAALIARSSAVLTNFFHGCVFALLNRKPFAAVSTPYRANKLRDLTQLLDAQRHLLDRPASRADFATLLDVPLEPKVEAAIQAGRGRSEAFLQAVLD
jgi:hypothetical protein